MYDKMRSTPLAGPAAFAKAPSMATSLIPLSGQAAAAPPAGQKPEGKKPRVHVRGDPAQKKEKKDTVDPYFRALSKTLADIKELEDLTAKVKEKGKDSTNSRPQNSGCLADCLRHVIAVR